MSTDEPAGSGPRYEETLGEGYFHEYMAWYKGYQERFLDDISERDKVMLKLVGQAAAQLRAARDGDEPVRLLDIGCGRGALLHHLRGAYPDLDLTGADLADDVIEECRSDPRLQGVRFETMDIFDIEGSFDIVTANAVAVYFDDEAYGRVLESVASALRPGGRYLAFEWLHPFRQNLTIVERTKDHPDGLEIHFRPVHLVEEMLEERGFADIEFHPFEIPVDLPMEGSKERERDVYEGIHTYTRRTSSGDRLQFRGALYQPWCHLVARRAGGEGAEGGPRGTAADEKEEGDDDRAG